MRKVENISKQVTETIRELVIFFEKNNNNYEKKINKKQIVIKNALTTISLNTTLKIIRYQTIILYSLA